MGLLASGLDEIPQGCAQRVACDFEELGKGRNVMWILRLGTQSKYDVIFEIPTTL